jgi:7-cyano-7-deazaguanine tRNA-ribosyltransferase
MDFYIAWYYNDPLYSVYDPNCSMLISVSSVAQRWKISDLPVQPKRVIIDSGGYRNATSDDIPARPRELFYRQLEMLTGVEGEAIICALDYPIINPKLNSNERDRLLHQTIANAYDFKELMRQTPGAAKYQSMVIIQGYDVASLTWCARQLRQIGFDRYGIGSLAVPTHYREMTKRIQAVTDIVGNNIHIFGVSATQMMARLRALNIDSIDSSTPAKAAIFNQIFYTNPFRRLQLGRSDNIRIAEHNVYLEQLEICYCPVCKGTANIDLLIVGKRHNKLLRTLHNYFHLKQEITGAPVSPL